MSLKKLRVKNKRIGKIVNYISKNMYTGYTSFFKYKKNLQNRIIYKNININIFHY